jgi:uncharacterized integral membrane protein
LRKAASLPAHIMIDLWIPLNMLVFAVAAWQNIRRIRKGNTHNGLRWVALVIASYIAVIYLLVIVGVIGDADVRLYMRWFQLPMGMYLILEAING